MDKSADAFRTISEVAAELDLPQHVLRFWETRFPQIKPLKRAGGRRFYRPNDVELLRAIRRLLYGEGYTIRGVQRILKEQGARAIIGAAGAAPEFAAAPGAPASEEGAADWGEDLFSPAAPASADEPAFAIESDERNESAEAAAADDRIRPGTIGQLREILHELETCERLLALARQPKGV